MHAERALPERPELALNVIHLPQKVVPLRVQAFVERAASGMADWL